jgi:DNA-binding PadR family transcriptional regulator
LDRELLLLGLLRQQEMHGYQLHEYIEGPLAFCTDLKRPTAYFLLDKLAKQGLVAEKETREGHRPIRHVFALTESGELEFQRLLRESLCRYSPVHFTGDISLAYLDEIEPAEAVALLTVRRAILADAVEKAAAAPAHAGSLQWVVEHQVRHLQAELDWLDEVIERLQAKARG